MRKRNRRSWCRHYDRARLTGKQAATALSSSPAAPFEGSKVPGGRACEWSSGAIDRRRRPKRRSQSRRKRRHPLAAKPATAEVATADRFNQCRDARDEPACGSACGCRRRSVIAARSAKVKDQKTHSGLGTGQARRADAFLRSEEGHRQDQNGARSGARRASSDYRGTGYGPPGTGGSARHRSRAGAGAGLDLHRRSRRAVACEGFCVATGRGDAIPA